jgi:hypothetical protein
VKEEREGRKARMGGVSDYLIVPGKTARTMGDLETKSSILLVLHLSRGACLNNIIMLWHWLESAHVKNDCGGSIEAVVGTAVSYVSCDRK